MIFYSYDEFAIDAKKMAKQIKDEFDPEVILAVARGGLTLGHSLAVALENRNLILSTMKIQTSLIRYKFLMCQILADTLKFCLLMTSSIAARAWSR